MEYLCNQEEKCRRNTENRIIIKNKFDQEIFCNKSLFRSLDKDLVFVVTNA